MTFGIRLGKLIGNEKAVDWIEGRKNWKQKLEQLNIPKNECIWIHVASLGEFEQGRNLMELIKENTPQQKILLTFFSPSGYNLKKTYEFADYILYLPSDTKANAQKFIEMVQPKIVIFVKYEFWYHFLKTIYTNKISLFLISGVFTKEHSFFKWYGGFMRKMLAFFNCFFLQDENSEKLLHKIGIKNTQVCGDTRVDRVATILQTTKKFPKVEAFLKNRKAIILGSSWQKDELITLDYINNNSDEKFIIAPHDISESHINFILKKYPTAIRYSKYTNQFSNVLIIDNIGMLSSLYQYAKWAYIGGGFGDGIHNTLEPITFKIPVVFGPKFKKFVEAKHLISLKAGFTIKNKIEFETIAKKLEDSTFRNNAGKRAYSYIQNSKGASQTIYNFIQKKI